MCVCGARDARCNVLTARARSTTARARNASRVANPNFLNCKNSDEIRTSCNAGDPLLSPRHEKFSCMRVKFCIVIACRADICTGKNNFHKLPRKWHAQTGIDQKMSESVPGDSRRARLAAENFSADARAERVSYRNFCSRARNRGTQLPHCT
jgi:hypothetical protein